MSYFPEELADPPPVTLTVMVPGYTEPGTAVIQEKAGTGYPVDGDDETYPNMPAVPPVATNPDGVANTPDEYPPTGTPPATIRYAYSPQTFEEKIAAMVPPGVPVTPVTVEPNEPYPTTP